MHSHGRVCLFHRIASLSLRWLIGYQDLYKPLFLVLLLLFSTFLKSRNTFTLLPILVAFAIHTILRLDMDPNMEDIVSELDQVVLGEKIVEVSQSSYIKRLTMS